jgi:hypothetical protein
MASFLLKGAFLWRGLMRCNAMRSSISYLKSSNIIMVLSPYGTKVGGFSFENRMNEKSLLKILK